MQSEEAEMYETMIEKKRCCEDNRERERIRLK